MMRHLRLVWIALIPIVLTVAAFLTLAGADLTSAQPGKTPTPSACTTDLRKWVDPDAIVLGDNTQVSLVVSGTCPAWNAPIDMVLVVDASNSMTKYKPGPAVGSPTAEPTRPLETEEPTPTGEPPDTRTPEPGNEGTPGAGTGSEPAFCSPVQPREPTPTNTPRRWPPRRTPTPAPHLPEATPDINQLEPAGGEDRIRDETKWVSDLLGSPDIETDMASDKLRIGMVAFNDRPVVNVALSNERSKVSSGVGRIRGGEVTRINVGLREAIRVLNGTGARPDAERTKVIVILSDFQFCAKDMRNLGIDQDTHVFAVGFGVRAFDRRKLNELASEGAYVSEKGALKPFMDAYTLRLSSKRAVSMSSLTVRDLLTDTMRLIPGSVNPPTVTITGQLLEWQFAPPGNPITLTYRVEPQLAGRWPVSERADIEFVDTQGQVGSGAFPPALIDVLVHTPTPTYTPTSTSTSTATSTSTPTETPAPRAKYFPIAFRLWPPAPTPTPAPTKCRPEQQVVDVAEVIDTSTSMSDPTAGGTLPKLTAAIEAAQELVNQLKPDDQATIIGYNSTPHVATLLTKDRAQITSALQSLPATQAVGTRIDLGLQAAYDELVGPRHQATNTRSIVLVTDGRHVGDANDVIAVADKIKAAGIAIITIGLGSDVDSALLREIASDPEYYYEAPNSEDLLEIYREIVRYIACPGQP